MRILVPILLLALSTAACVRAPEPESEPAPPRPIPRPVPQATPAPPPGSSDWRDWPITPGMWSMRDDARGSIALFGAPGADAALTIRCDTGARAIYLSRAGDARATSLAIRTSTTARTLTAQPTGATPAYVAARLAPDDRLLDAIGFSRGRFVVEAPPLATLVVPANPEILRVVEDCRG